MATYQRANHPRDTYQLRLAAHDRVIRQGYQILQHVNPDSHKEQGPPHLERPADAVLDWAYTIQHNDRFECSTNSEAS